MNSGSDNALLDVVVLLCQSTKKKEMKEQFLDSKKVQLETLAFLPLRSKHTMYIDYGTNSDILELQSSCFK